MEIPLFCSVNDLDDYLRWVQKVEDLFDCEEYSEAQKCRLASRQFRGRVYFWWNDLMALMRENGNSEFRNWELMKSLMTRHFIPPDVKDKFYLKLQRLKQGDLSVEDYVKVFKLFVIASDLGESEVQKIKRFISGLKSEIRKDFGLVLQWSPFLSLKNIISLALERESWSTKVDSESGVNVEVVLSDHKEK